MFSMRFCALSFSPVCGSGLSSPNVYTPSSMPPPLFSLPCGATVPATSSISLSSTTALAPALLGYLLAHRRDYFLREYLQLIVRRAPKYIAAEAVLDREHGEIIDPA